MSRFAYRNRCAFDSRTPSMIEAWFSSSLMTASSAPSRVSNTPPLASKHEGNRMVSSVPSHSVISASSCLCSWCVPLMNRTLAMPKPSRSRAACAAGDHLGVGREAEIVVGAQVQVLAVVDADRGGPAATRASRSCLNSPAPRISSSVSA